MQLNGRVFRIIIKWESQILGGIAHEDHAVSLWPHRRLPDAGGCPAHRLFPAAGGIPRKDPIPVEQPSDASAALDDGKLRILYDSNGSTVLCGSKVLHEGRGDETVALVYDPAESDIPYYWVAWSDNSSPLRPPQRPLR